MMRSSVADMIRAGASETVELKSARADKDAIGRAVCGMLNQRGGQVFWGVDENGKLQGMGDAEERVRELNQWLTERLAPRPLLLVRAEDLPGGTVIVVEVAAGEERPYSYERGIWVRIGARTMRADPEDVGDMVRSGSVRASAWEDEPVLGFGLEHCDAEELKQARSEMERTGRLGMEVPVTDEQLLDKLYMVRRGQYTHGAVVLFAQDPAYWMPQAGLRLAIYASDVKQPSHMQSFQGPAIRCLKQAVDAVVSRTASIVRFHAKDPVRVDQPEYDPGSVREAIVNALVHRDYRRSGTITLSMYPDRLEVHNPADLPAGWHADVERVSKPYNPNIARVFLYRGLMEGLGVGMDRIRRAAKAAGAKEPRWAYERGVLTLTLYKATTTEGHAPNPVEQRLLKLLSKPQAASALAEAVELSARQLRRILTDMESRGLVQRVGKGPATQYKRQQT